MTNNEQKASRAYYRARDEASKAAITNAEHALLGSLSGIMECPIRLIEARRELERYQIVIANALKVCAAAQIYQAVRDAATVANF